MSVLKGTLAALLCGFLSVAAVQAADPASDTADVKAPAKTATAAEIDDWIKELDGNSFAGRLAAARKLSEAGGSAIDALGKAALGESLEVTRQAIDILRRHYQSSNAATKEAAAAALKMIASSDNKSAAARANEILNEAKAEATSNAAPQNGLIGPVRVIGGGIQIGGGGPGGGIQIIGGQGGIQLQGAKSMEIDENGHKVKIEEDGQKIKISTTEKVNGQDQTETTEAKDLDELKKKNPAHAKVYEKYAKGNGVGAIQIQIQAQAVPFGPGIPNQIPGGVIPAIPAIPLNPAMPLPNGIQQIIVGQAQAGLAPNTDELKNLKEGVERAQKKLDEALQQLKSNPAEAAKAIEAAKQELKDAQKSDDK